MAWDAPGSATLVFPALPPAVLPAVLPPCSPLHPTVQPRGRALDFGFPLYQFRKIVSGWKGTLKEVFR